MPRSWVLLLAGFLLAAPAPAGAGVSVRVYWVEEAAFAGSCGAAGGETEKSSRSFQVEERYALSVSSSLRCWYRGSVIDPFTSSRHSHFALEPGVHFQPQTEADHLRMLRELEETGVRTELAGFEPFRAGCAARGGLPGVWIHGVSPEGRAEWQWSCRELRVEPVRGTENEIPEITVVAGERDLLPWMRSPWRTRDVVGEGPGPADELAGFLKRKLSTLLDASSQLPAKLPFFPDEWRPDYESYRQTWLETIRKTGEASEKFAGDLGSSAIDGIHEWDRRTQVLSALREAQAKLNPFLYVEGSEAGAHDRALFADLTMACTLGAYNGAEDVVFSPFRDLALFGFFLLKKTGRFVMNPVGEVARSSVFALTLAKNVHHIFFTIREQIALAYAEFEELEESEIAHIVCYFGSQIYGSKMLYDLVLGKHVAGVLNTALEVTGPPTREAIQKILHQLRVEKVLARMLENHRIEKFLKGYSKLQLWDRARRLEKEIRALITRATGHTKRVEVRAKDLLERDARFLLKSHKVDPGLDARWTRFEKDLGKDAVFTKEMQTQVFGKGSSEFRLLELDKDKPDFTGMTLFDGQDRVEWLRKVARDRPDLKIQVDLHLVDTDETLARITRMRHSLRYTLAEYHYQESGVPFEEWGIPSVNPLKDPPPRKDQ